MASNNPSFVCLRCVRALRTQTATAPSTTSRLLSTAAPRKQSTSPSSTAAGSEQLPRWHQTPAPMRMPFRVRPMPNQPEFRVNTKQEPLDEMYDRFVGRAAEGLTGQGESTRGRDLLPEEVKWLAVTHKSFDHGRRGFNDRLAHLGRRILDLQTSIALLSQPTPPHLDAAAMPSQHVYKHTALAGLENVTPFAKHEVLEPARLARVATQYGLDRVLRWKPKKSDNLQGSGVDAVLAHSVYAVVGALALQRGGEVAARTARERILGPLGLK